MEERREVQNIFFWKTAKGKGTLMTLTLGQNLQKTDVKVHWIQVIQNRTQ